MNSPLQRLADRFFGGRTGLGSGLGLGAGPSAGPVMAQRIVRPAFATRFHIDMPLLLLLLALSAVGLAVLYSASGQREGLLARQGAYFMLGWLAFFAAAQISLPSLRRFTPRLYFAGICLLVAVLAAGSEAKGAQRWLAIGGLRFQPSEFLKLLVPMMVAWHLSAGQLPPRFWRIAACVGLLLLPAALVLRQPDLGTALLIAMAGLFVLFLAGIGWRYILGALLSAALSAWPLWAHGLKEYQKQRVLTMLNPESDKLGAGWNIIQSKTAIGSGGWAGKGWLNGTQSQLDFLPEGHTDFIMAVLAEEFGLLGVAFLLVLYGLITARGLWIGAQARDTYARLLAGGLSLGFFLCLFVNMGMVAGLLPVVGIPLPLISAGGTSLVSLMAGFGILMAISTERRLLGS